MNRKIFWLRLAVLLCFGGRLLSATPQEVLEVQNITYLQHVPMPSEKMKGSLRIGPNKIEFLAKGKVQFAIECNNVEYVAAQAEASIRARSADVGSAVAVTAGVLFPPAFALLFLFHKGEKHLLSIEYLEGDEGVRRLALFNVRDHSSRAVKKLIDTRLSLTTEYYKGKDREKEERKRRKEEQTTPAAYWETTENTMIGDSQYARVLLERGRYSILIMDRYVGLAPESVGWAKYRIPIREVKRAKPPTKALLPIYKSSRLVGFEFGSWKYVFY